MKILYWRENGGRLVARGMMQSHARLNAGDTKGTAREVRLCGDAQEKKEGHKGAVWDGMTHELP